MSRRISEKLPGLSWRVLAHPRCPDGRFSAGPPFDHRFEASSLMEFDELCLGAPGRGESFLHLEQMGSRLWYMGFGGKHQHQMSLWFGRNGNARICHYELGDLEKLLKQPPYRSKKG